MIIKLEKDEAWNVIWEGLKSLGLYNNKDENYKYSINCIRTADIKELTIILYKEPKEIKEPITPYKEGSWKE